MAESLIFAESGDFSEKELNQIEKLVTKNQEILIDAFNKVKDGESVKTIKLKS